MIKYKMCYLTRFLVCICVLSLCSSCGQDEPSCPIEPCIPIDTIPIDTLSYDYTLLWEQLIYEDMTLHYGNCLIKFHEGSIFFSRKIPGLLKDREELISLDALNGSTQWVYDDNGVNIQFNGYNIYDDQYIFPSANSFLYKLNRNTGELIWKVEKGSDVSGMGYIAKIDESYLLGGIGYGTSEPYKHEIVVINKQTGSMDTIITEEKTDSFLTAIQWPVTFNNAQGDDMIIYNVVKSKNGPFESHAHLVCHNLTQKNNVWIKEDFTAAGRLGGRNPPIIKDGKVYVLGFRTMHCFDLVTGEEYWKQEYLGTNFGGSNFLLEENVVVFISDEGHLVGLDKDTGSELYINEYSANTDGLTYHDGHIIYASEDLFFVDIKTGLIKHRFETKNRNYNNGYFTNRVAIDRDKEILYVIDNFFIQAIKMPDLN